MQTTKVLGLRVAVYARVSTEEQRQGETVNSQIAELEKFADQNSWTIVQVYKDEGWSGGVLARPELDRLRDDAKENKFEAVLLNDVDRLARDVTHLGIVKRDLERSNVRLVFRKLPGEDSPTHELMVNILGSFAQFERELIADRTRRGIRHKAEVRQQYVGCTAPYGYRYLGKRTESPDAGILQVEPPEAHVVRRVFQWVADEGLSLNQVARRLQQEHVLTRTGKSHWQVSMVWKIIRNRTYIGHWAYAKHESIAPLRPRTKSYMRRVKTSRRTKPRSEWIDVALPPEFRIVDKLIWERAQRQIDANPRWCSRNTKHKYLLQGLARCGFCKRVAFGTYAGKEPKIYMYYRCSRACAASHWIPQDIVEETTWNAVKEALQNPRTIEPLIARARQEMLDERKHATSQQENMSQLTLKQQEDRLIAEYRSGKLSGSDLGDQLKRIERQSDPVKPGGERQTAPTHSIQSLAEYVAQFANRIENASFDTRQLVLRQVATSVFLSPEKIVVRVAIPDAIEEDVWHTQPSYTIGSIPSSESISNYRMIEFDIEAKLK